MRNEYPALQGTFLLLFYLFPLFEGLRVFRVPESGSVNLENTPARRFYIARTFHHRACGVSEGMA